MPELPPDKPSPFEPSQFVKDIVEEYQREGGLVGEDRNIATLFFSCLSKDLPRNYRLHVIISSSSASGKSKLVNTITTPFRSCVLDYTRVSGAGLERYEGVLDGRILLYQQTHGSEPYQFKPMMTEWKLVVLIAEKEEGSSTFVSKTISKEGMPVLLSTTTDPNLDPELLNRAILITLDESREQTRRIMQLQAKRAASLADVDNTHPWPHINQMIDQFENIKAPRVVDIVNPFAQELEVALPDESVELRRDFPKLLNLASVIAYTKGLWHQEFYRMRRIQKLIKTPVEIEGGRMVVVVKTEDVHDALWCLGDDWLLQLPDTAKRILNYLRILKETEKDEKGEEYFVGYKEATYRMIRAELQLKESTTRDNCDLLMERGFITATVEPSWPHSKKFQYSPDGLELLMGQIKLEESDRTEWISKNLSEATSSRIEEPKPPTDSRSPEPALRRDTQGSESRKVMSEEESES